MLQKHKKQLILSSILILLPIVIGLVLWNVLPEPLTTHWNSRGEADGFSSKVFAVFVFPLIMLAAHWLGLWITSLDPKTKNQSEKVSGMVIWIMPLISLVLHGMLYATALGMEVGIDLGLRVILGGTFVIMGNYMPKCKHNHTVGIKVVWALRNEENWNKTHRFAGKVWFCGGIAILLTMMLPLENIAAGFAAILLLLALLPILYSYLYYRKQLQSGTATEADSIPTSAEKKVTRIATAVGIIVACFALFFLTSGRFDVELEATYFSIDALYWEDTSVNYADIDTIEYRTTDNPGDRTFGYGAPGLLMGEFENSEFGAYTRYSYTSCKSCIVLTIGERTMVMNSKDESGTKELYEKLLEKTDK